MAVVMSAQSGGTVEISKATLAQPYCGVVPLCTGSGNQPNAEAKATLTGTATSCVYLAGIIVTGSGAQAAKTVLVTVDGLLGGTRSFCYGFIQSVTAPNIPLILNFNPPLQAAAIDAPVMVTVPAGGAGNLNSMVTAYGFYSTVSAVPVI